MRVQQVMIFVVAASVVWAIAPSFAGEARRTQALADRPVVTAALGDGAGALPAATVPVAAAGPARPMAAWLAFCRGYAPECRVDLSEPEAIRLTPAIWRDIVAVNTEVNTTIRPVTDMDHWGVVDKWDLAEDGSGDCEDFQLLKRKRLAELGLPRRAMPITVVLDDRNEGHAVLMVRTDRGDFILDNKRNEVLPWLRTGYTYVKRESQSELAWTSLSYATGVTATASR